MEKSIANKKNVNNKAGYVVKPIAIKDIVKQADFGTFKITKTRESIAYTNYVGYTVITKPYTTTPEGKATELSLYAWLNYMLESKEYLDTHKDEPFEDFGITCGDWLETLKIVTESNITKPCVIFTDSDYAMQEANRHVKWLNEKSKQLMETMAAPPHEEDEKANAEEIGHAIDVENAASILNVENLNK